MRRSRPGSRLLRRLRRRVLRIRVRNRARIRAAASATARWRSGRWLGTAGRSRWPRRTVLLAALLALAFVPYPVQNAPALLASAGCRSGCHQAKVNMIRWSVQLPGEWDLDNGLAGTVPDGGTGYVAVADGIAVLAVGMTVYAYQASNGHPLWQQTLTGFPAGAAIVSVRCWPGEVTAGVSYRGPRGASKRTEVVLPDTPASLPGTPASQYRQYPAAPFGGAVAATSQYTVIVGPSGVTSYDNASGKVRWQRPTGVPAQGWRIDGQYLYLAESAGGDQDQGVITALRRIDTSTGAEQQVLPQPGAGIGTTGAASAFDGTLDGAFDGDVLFSAATGVTAYSGATGIELWSVPDSVPEGADPRQNQLYLARGTTLLQVSPSTGQVEATAPDLGGGMYVVRNGLALGLDAGSEGAAWGYDIAAERVALSASALGWPHYFADLSGVGGSADPDGDLVIIAACGQAGPPAATTSPSVPAGSPGLSGGAVPPADSPSPGATTTSPTPSATPAGPAVQPCLRPELVALRL